MLRTEIDSMPADLDELTRKLTRWRSKKPLFPKKSDENSKARLEALRRQLADLRSEADAMRAQWEAERRALRKVQSLHTRRSNTFASKLSRPSAIMTSTRQRSFATGSYPTSNAGWRQKKRSSSLNKVAHACSNEVVTDAEKYPP